jgi:methylmalonyl-CoA mutase
MSETVKRSYPHGRVVEPLYTEGPETGAGYRKQPWWSMVQEHLVEKEFAANDWALQRLTHGASGLLFYLNDTHFLPRIVKDIQLEHIDLHLVVEGSGAEVMEALLHFAHDQTISAAELTGTINIDPIEIAARTGEWNEALMYDLGELSRLAPKGMRYMCANANFYGACGASAEMQLGLAAAHLEFYLDTFGTVGLEQYWLALTSGTYVFEEIAKYRAMRLLWARLLEEKELPAVHLEIYAETSTAQQSAYDVHTNLLRATSAAFGAVVGGADALQIRPYNSITTFADPEGERLALNQHFVLAYESYLDRVEDPAAGAFYIETLTDEFGKAAWAILGEIREQGGLLEALEQGWVQDELATEKAKAMPEKVMGVNLYPNAKDALPAGYVAKKNRSREDWQKRHEGKSIEPLIPVQWAADLESERAESSPSK